MTLDPQKHVIPPLRSSLASGDVASLKSTFNSTLERIRKTVIDTRKQLGSINGSDSSVRKVQNHVKEGARLENSLAFMQDELQKCYEILLEETQNVTADKTTTPDELLEKLEKIAQMLKLESFKDTAVRDGSTIPVDTIMMGGKVMVVDIDIEREGSSSKVKVSYITEKNQDDRLDELLSQDLCDRNLPLFREHLSMLVLLDRLTAQYAPLDFFTISKILFESYQAMAGDQSLLDSLSGPGLPLYNIENPGTCLAFYIDALARELRKDDFNIKCRRDLEGIHYIHIDFEEDTGSIPFFENENLRYISKEDVGDDIKEFVIEMPQIPGMTEFKLFSPSSKNPSANVKICGTLSKPIPMYTLFASQILSADSITQSIQGTMLNDAETLEYYLASSPSQPFNSAADYEISLPGINPNLVFNYGQPRPQLNMVLISKIPLEHPADIFRTLPMMRRQLAFNELFTSVFNPSLLRKETEMEVKKEMDLNDLISPESMEVGDVRIEISPLFEGRKFQFGLAITFVNPYKLNFPSFEVVKECQIISIQVVIPEGTCKPEAFLYGSPEQDKDINDKLTALIQQTLDIPCVVGWVLKQLAERVQEDVKEEKETELIHDEIVVEIPIHAQRPDESMVDMED